MDDPILLENSVSMDQSIGIEKILYLMDIEIKYSLQNHLKLVIIIFNNLLIIILESVSSS
jgi:hypothetical protein